MPNNIKRIVKYFQDSSKYPDIMEYQWTNKGVFRMWSPNGQFVNNNDSYYVGVAKQKKSKSLPSLGYCVFCGSRDNLTDEHIIPEFFGSGLKIIKSCCSTCQKNTSKFESSIASNMFDPIRKYLSLKGKNGRLKKSNFKLDIGREKTEYKIFPINEYPVLLTLPRFHPASAISNRPFDTEGLFDLIIYNFNIEKERLIEIVNELSTLHIDTLLFCQLLAKIAHSFAVFHLGLDGFNQTLQSFIKSDFISNKSDATSYQSQYNYIGCCYLANKERQSDMLHELELGRINSSGKSFYAVKIRLFSYLVNLPSYYVIVGY